jgi:hypothetical protein
MTVRDLLVAVRRTWYVAVFGVVATVFLVLSVSQQPGMFQARVDVLLLLPQSANNPNSYTATTESLIDTAGIVATVLSGASGAPLTSSSTVTLAGQGIRDGWSVRLPNSGGQWANNFDRPLLDVQVVGPSHDAVLKRANELVTRIEAELIRRQDRAGVSPHNLIRTRLSPPTPQVSFSRGSPTRALAASLLLGVLLTTAACVVADQKLASLQFRRIFPVRQLAK